MPVENKAVVELVAQKISELVDESDPILSINTPSWASGIFKRCNLKNIQVHTYDFSTFEFYKNSPYSVTVDLPLTSNTENCCLVLFWGTKDRDETRFLMDFSISIASKSSGIVMGVMSNDHGSKRYSKELGEKLGSSSVSGGGGVESETKARTRVFWGRMLKEDLELTSLNSEITNEDGLKTCPGIFSWRRLDRGTSLLIEVLKCDKLSGKILDLGSGYGALLHGLISQGTIDSNSYLTVLDSDFRCAELARENIEESFPSFKVTSYWADVCTLDKNKDLAKEKFDFIVMNPPFHEYGKVNQNSFSSSVLNEFISQATKLISKSGKIFFVTHSRLVDSSSKLLEKHRVKLIAEDKEFGVFEVGLEGR